MKFGASFEFGVRPAQPVLVNLNLAGVSASSKRDDPRQAVLSIEYLDHEGQVVDAVQRGASKSERYGTFVYVDFPVGIKGDRVQTNVRYKLAPPSGAAWVKLVLHSFSIKAVQIDRCEIVQMQEERAGTHTTWIADV